MWIKTLLEFEEQSIESEKKVSGQEQIAPSIQNLTITTREVPNTGSHTTKIKHRNPSTMESRQLKAQTN